MNFFILQIRGFFFALCSAILAAAWIRGGGLALGGDSWGTTVAAASLLISLSIGLAVGSRLVRGTRSRWWPFFAVFGILGGLVVLFIPSFAASFQHLYHGLGQKTGALVASLGLFSLIAFLPWFFGGIAFARLSACEDLEMLTPVGFGSVAGIALLDFWVGPTIGGTVTILLAGAGIWALSVGLNNTAPLVQREFEGRWKEFISACAFGVVLACAAKVLLFFVVQFIPASRSELSWAFIILILAVCAGAVSFGKATVNRQNPLLWAGFFIACSGAFLCLSGAVLHYLSSSARYVYYFNFFGAKEGSWTQELLVIAALGGLSSVAAGAGLRCLVDPISTRGTPSCSAVLSGLGLGVSVGTLLTNFVLIPEYGLRAVLVLVIFSLVGLGVLLVLLFSEGRWAGRITATIFPVALLMISFSLIPEKLEIQNPGHPGSISQRASVEGPDGMVRATMEPGRVLQIWWNHNAVTPPEQSLDRMELSLSVILSQGPREALLLSPLTPERSEMLKALGLSKVDLAPHAPILGEISFKLNSENRAPALTSYRAPAGLSQEYPLILALPEPLWLSAFSSRWNGEMLEAMKGRLSEDGSLILWLRAQEASASSLRSIAKTFSEVFPDTTAYLALTGMEGPSFALVGRKKPLMALGSVEKMEKLIEEMKQIPWFEEVPIQNLQDIRALEIAHRERILETTVDSWSNRGPLPFLAWNLSPRFGSSQQKEGLEFLTALATSGANSSGSASSGDRGEALRLTLSGFVEHLQNQGQIEENAPDRNRSELSEDELRRFFEALKASPEFSVLRALWLKIGAQLLQASQSALCRAYFEKISALIPDHPGILSILGRAQRMDSQFAEASKTLRKSIALEPKDPLTWYYLGMTYRDLGNHREAARAHEESKKLKPRDTENLFGLALAYRDLGDGERAFKALEELKTISPQDPRLRELEETIKR